VGSISIKSDAAVSEVQLGAFGLCVVTDRAVAIGLTAVPGPIANIDEDVWATYVPILQTTEVLTAVGVEPNFATLYHFDSKAKCILQDGYSLAVMVENAHATEAFDIAFLIRVLSMVRGTG